MKSIPYLLEKKPCTLDDFLHLVRGQQSVSVDIELSKNDHIDDTLLAKELAGAFHWRLADGEHVCRRSYGCYRLGMGDMRWTIARANRKLERDVNRLRESGVRITGEDRRFDTDPALL